MEKRDHFQMSGGGVLVDTEMGSARVRAETLGTGCHASGSTAAGCGFAGAAARVGASGPAVITVGPTEDVGAAAAAGAGCAEAATTGGDAAGAELCANAEPLSA